jgi:diguanylate cyclase (GGDEF)-like protein
MEFISVPTVALCMFIAMVAITVAMAAVWLNDRRETAAGFWSLGFAFGALSGVTIAVMQGGSPRAIFTATLLNAVAYGFVWAGYRAFGKSKTDWKRIVALPIAVIVFNLAFPEISANPNNAIVVQSSMVMILSVINAYEVYTGEHNRDLPLSVALIGFLLLHATFHCANLTIAYLDPAPIVDGRMQSLWLKLFMLEAFLNVIVIATVCLMLIKDRSEQRHRIASETDMLTGIANRRAFVQRTELALREAGGDAVLAIIDLDYFKSINDQFGHQAGDRALIEFAHAVCGLLPDDVLFGRIGGEEVAGFVPGRPARAPTLLLDELRRKVEALALRSAGCPIPLTASIGGASVEKAGVNFDNLVAAADCALYAAKEEGRNRIAMFTPAMRLLKVIESSGEKRVGLTDQRISRRVTRPLKPATPHS